MYGLCHVLHIFMGFQRAEDIYFDVKLKCYSISQGVLKLASGSKSIPPVDIA